MNNRRVKFAGVSGSTELLFQDPSLQAEGVDQWYRPLPFRRSLFLCGVLQTVGGGQYLLHGGLLCCNHTSLNISMSGVGLQANSY